MENEKNDAVFTQAAENTQPAAASAPETKKKSGKSPVGIIIGVAAAAVVLIAVCAAFVVPSVLRGNAYRAAEAALAGKDYEQAETGFLKLGDYLDSREKYADAWTGELTEIFELGDVESAYDMLEIVLAEDESEKQALSDERYDYTRPELSEAARQLCYDFAGSLMESGSYSDASVFYELDADYKDSAEMAKEALYQHGIALYRSGEFYDAQKKSFELLDGYKDTDLYSVLCGYQLIAKGYEEYFLFSATDYFNELKDYSGDNEDVHAFLNSPYFFLSRIANASWKNGAYAINFRVEGNRWTMWQYLPWKTPSGSTWSCRVTDDGLQFNVGENYWLTITGFSDKGKTVELHPDEVYILGSDGKEYTFSLNAGYN